MTDVQTTYCFDIFPNIDWIEKVEMPVCAAGVRVHVEMPTRCVVAKFMAQATFDESAC